MTTIYGYTLDDIKGQIKRLIRNLRTRFEIYNARFEINTAYGVCNIDFFKTKDDYKKRTMTKRITIHSSKQKGVYEHLLFVNQVLELDQDFKEE